ncbi:hypothetical protein NL676_027302 [Syzygium grande]|nr:hypothetical protein NL676_027302 [Syzygium grande]
MNDRTKNDEANPHPHEMKYLHSRPWSDLIRPASMWIRSAAPVFTNIFTFNSVSTINFTFYSFYFETKSKPCHMTIDISVLKQVAALHGATIAKTVSVQHFHHSAIS